MVSEVSVPNQWALLLLSLCWGIIIMGVCGQEAFSLPAFEEGQGRSVQGWVRIQAINGI